MWQPAGEHHVERPERFVRQPAVRPTLPYDRVEEFAHGGGVPDLMDPDGERRVRTEVDVVPDGVAPQQSGRDPRREPSPEPPLGRGSVRTTVGAVVGIEPPEEGPPAPFVFDDAGVVDRSAGGGDRPVAGSDEPIPAVDDDHGDETDERPDAGHRTRLPGRRGGDQPMAVRLGRDGQVSCAVGQPTTEAVDTRLIPPRSVRATVRVVLFTGEEPLFLPRLLAPVFEAHAGEIAATVIVPPAGGRRRELRRQLRLFGPVAGFRIGVRVLGARLLGALPSGLDRALTGRSFGVAGLARAFDTPVHRVDDLEDPAVRHRLATLDPSLLLSVVCPRKIPEPILDIPDRAINLHGSLLPKYRGRATAFWPLYYGDDRSGVTAHVMTSTFDAGPILAQRSFPIDPDDTYWDVARKIAETGGTLSRDLLARPIDDLDTRPNPTGPADYHTIPTPAQRRTFKRRGNAFR